jgi:hypothetical protein
MYIADAKKGFIFCDIENSQGFLNVQLNVALKENWDFFPTVKSELWSLFLGSHLL